jgi:hypothetical protein
VEGKPGIREVAVLIEQSTAAGPRWTRVARPILVTPAEDLVIFADGPSRGWQDPVGGTGVTVDAQEQLVVAQGQRAIRVVAKATGYTTVDLRPAEPMLLAGYDSLRFMFHPGDATAKAGGFLQVRLVAYTYTGSGTAYDQYLGTYLISPTASDQKMVDLDARQWQQVSIPLSAVAFDLAPWKYSGPVDLLEVLRFRAIIKGTFYLDEVRLVAARPAAPPATAVLEEYAAARPSAFALSQNYPNPFNSGTVIRFSLPAAGDVELVLYNLTGQEVASLAQGRREAGTYALRWDGRDAKGQELASGVYLYQLQAGTHSEVRKLLLLR